MAEKMILISNKSQRLALKQQGLSFKNILCGLLALRDYLERCEKEGSLHQYAILSSDGGITPEDIGNTIITRIKDAKWKKGDIYGMVFSNLALTREYTKMKGADLLALAETKGIKEYAALIIESNLY